MTQEDPRIDRRELKGPDELMLATGEVVRWLRTHLRQAIGIGIGVTLLILVVVGGFAYRERTAVAARAEFDAAFRSYAALDMGTAQRGFLAFVEKHPSGSLADLARLYLGTAATQKRDLAVAKKAFEGLLASSPGPLVEQIAHYNLGVLAREAGEKDQARGHFTSAVKIPGPIRLASRIALSADPGSAATAPSVPRLEQVPDDIVEYLDGRSAGPK